MLSHPISFQARSAPFVSLLILAAMAAPAAALPVEETSSFAQTCNSLSPPCRFDIHSQSASSSYNAPFDSWASAGASHGAGIRAAASSQTENYTTGSVMDATARQTTAFDVTSGSLADGTMVDLQMQINLDGSLFAGDYAYGSAGVELTIDITLEDSPSVLSGFWGTAGAGGSGVPNQFIFRGGFEQDDFTTLTSGYALNMTRNFNFAAPVGDSSFSIAYELKVNSGGQGLSDFANTGHFSMRSLTEGVEVTAVPEPGSGLLLASGLLALAGFRRRA